MSKWTTGLKCDLAKDCSYKDKLVDPKVSINNETWLVIRKLCAEVQIEWQMMLIGTIEEGTLYKVTGYYIPKQVVSYASVEDKDNLPVSWYKEHNVIGTLHSHGNMNVFFSGTDDTNNQNSPVALHVVVNNKDEYVACVRGTLPCGMEAFMKCNVEVFVSHPNVVVEGFDRIEKAGTPTFNEARDTHAWDKDSEYLGYDAEGEPVWGTRADKDRIESQKEFQGFKGYGGGDYSEYPTLEELEALERRETKGKKRKSKGLHPWGHV